MTISSPSTASITLENWLPADLHARNGSQTYHFALRQDRVSLDFHLRQYFKSEKISVHYFTHFETLIEICQRFPINAILIAGSEDFMIEIELVRAIKENVFLSIIPVILYHPDPPVQIVVAAFESGAEEFIHGDWVDRLVDVRIRRVIERNRRDVSVNPSTQLPGTAIIEKEINRHLELDEPFAICYADLDNFKAYNDYYGYYAGDKVVKLTARIIRDTVFDICRMGFVGHIAGDDFMFIIPKDVVDRVCSSIIETFDTVIPYRYQEEDRLRACITTLNRKGHVETYPILTISIAVTINEPGQFQHIGEISKMMADLKRAVKMRPGSNYMVERRGKY